MYAEGKHQYDGTVGDNIPRKVPEKNLIEELGLIVLGLNLFSYFLAWV